MISKSVAVFLVMFAFIMTIPVILLDSWVITKLWGWYIVPAFGIAPISMVTAFGITVLVGMLQLHSHVEDKRDISLKVLGFVVAPLGALLMGWIGTFFQ